MNLRRFAKKLLRRHPEPDRRHKMVAIILKGRRIVAYGYNSSKTHPEAQKTVEKHNLNAYCSNAIHAEVSAISRSSGGNRIFVARIRADGKFGLAKPCPICEKIIESAGIYKVEYTKDEI